MLWEPALVGAKTANRKFLWSWTAKMVRALISRLIFPGNAIISGLEEDQTMKWERQVSSRTVYTSCGVHRRGTGQTISPDWAMLWIVESLNLSREAKRTKHPHGDVARGVCSK